MKYRSLLSVAMVLAWVGAWAPGFSQTPAADRPAAPLSIAAKAPPVQATPVPAVEKPVTAEMRGDIAMARKMYREAIEHYRAVQPPTAVTWNKIGIAYHHLMDMGAARKAYERAIRLNPKYPEPVNNLGAVYYAQRSYRRAIGQYQRALRLSPNSASILSNLGTAWFARKKYEQAADCYQRALAIDAEIFEHRGTTGILLQERSVEERAKFHFFLAKTYAKAGAHERALSYMRKALEEGFKDRKRFVEDPEFAGMQQLPEFQELLVLQPRVL